MCVYIYIIYIYIYIHDTYICVCVCVQHMCRKVRVNTQNDVAGDGSPRSCSKQTDLKEPCVKWAKLCSAL